MCEHIFKSTYLELRCRSDADENCNHQYRLEDAMPGFSLMNDVLPPNFVELRLKLKKEINQRRRKKISKKRQRMLKKMKKGM